MQNYGTLPGRLPVAAKTSGSEGQDKKFGYKPIDKSINSLPAKEFFSTPQRQEEDR